MQKQERAWDVFYLILAPAEFVKIDKFCRKRFQEVNRGEPTSQVTKIVPVAMKVGLGGPYIELIGPNRPYFGKDGPFGAYTCPHDQPTY